MRLAVAFALVVAVAPLGACKKSTSGGAEKPAATTVTVTLAPPTVGTRWIEVDDFRIEAEVVKGTQSAWFGSTRHHRTRYEVLEVDAAGLVTKVAVSYLEREDRADGPGAPSPRPSAIAGKAYVVAVVDGRITATHADGSPVRPAERIEIAEAEKALGQPPAMAEILARTWKLGEPVELTADERRRLIERARDDAPRPTAVSFTLREVRADEIELAMRTRMESHGDVSMIIDGNGTVILDARTGRTKLLRLSGAVNGTAGGLPLSGNLRASTTYDVATD